MFKTRRRTKQSEDKKIARQHNKQEKSNQTNKEILKEQKGKKKEVATCINCSKVIFLETEKYVMVGTYLGNQTMEEQYFHFQCWADYFKDRVMKKVSTLFNQTMGNFVGVIKQAKEQGVLG